MGGSSDANAARAGRAQCNYPMLFYCLFCDRYSGTSSASIPVWRSLVSLSKSLEPRNTSLMAALCFLSHPSSMCYNDESISHDGCVSQVRLISLLVAVQWGKARRGMSFPGASRLANPGLSLHGLVRVKPFSSKKKHAECPCGANSCAAQCTVNQAYFKSYAQPVSLGKLTVFSLLEGIANHSQKCTPDRTSDGQGI
jgi:hypothetical protein